jgi:hypothetical protein
VESEGLRPGASVWKQLYLWLMPAGALTLTLIVIWASLSTIDAAVEGNGRNAAFTLQQPAGVFRAAVEIEQDGHYSSGAISATATPTCIAAWAVAGSPNAGSYENFLTGVTPASSTEFWEVGYSRDTITSLRVPMTQRWDGTQWSIVATPPVTETGYLQAVDAVSPTDIWAVGYSNSGAGTQSLIMHWDGSGWSIVPSPNRSAYQYQDYLMGVTAISANDVWAVGRYRPSGHVYYSTLMLHWDGATWNVVNSPNVGFGLENVLSAVDAVSATDIWAVGQYELSGEYQTLALHWDGAIWSVVSTPNPGTYNNYLTDVSATPDGTVWAVGYRGIGSSNQGTRVIALRWNGSAWQSMNAPNPDGTLNELRSVTVIAPSDVWAVGYFGVAQRTLITHWDGVAWTSFPGINGAESGNYLNAIAVSPVGKLWAVGNFTGGGTTKTLTIYYPGDGCAFPTPTLTPTITPTPACGLDWRAVHNPGPDSSLLFDVAAISPTDIWAVGSHYSGTLTMHWNGSAWSIVPSPNANGFSRLHGVSATAANDVWAVGFHNTPLPNIVAMLVMHWNGTQWSLNPGPEVDCYQCIFNDVAAVSPNEVYAIGYSTDTVKSGPIIARWAGAQWGKFYPSTSGRLQSIAAITANDIWTVGKTDSGDTLTIHWDGGAWSVVSSPNPSPYNNALTGVDAVAANDVWAVGYSQNNGLPRRTLIEHWDGNAWSVVSSPSPGAGDNTLDGVTALSAGDIWAVGLYNNGSGAPNRSLTIHWNGSYWSETPSPSPGESWNELRAVAALGSSDLWGVGYITTQTEAFILHYSSLPCAGTVTPIDTPLPLTSTSTPTRTATRTATASPTASPTTCPPGNWASRAAYPVRASAAAGVAQGGMLYIFGGLTSGGGAINSAYKYDPNTNLWTQLADIPAARSDASAVSDGTYIYILNGMNANVVQSTLWRYDPITNTYTSLALAPIATRSQEVVYQGGKLYRIAGCTTGFCADVTASVDVYTTSTNSWAPAGTVADYPLATHDHSAVAYGGYTYGTGGDTDLGKTYRYDPITNSWSDSAVTDLSIPRYAAVTGILNGRWLLAGGSDRSYYSNTAVALSLSNPTEGWMSLPDMGIYRAGQAGGTIGTSFHAVGGAYNPVIVQDHREYTEAPCIGFTATSTTTATATSSANTATAIATPTIVPTSTLTNTPLPTQTAGGPTATTIPSSTSTGTATRTPTRTNTAPPTQTPGGPTATTPPVDTATVVASTSTSTTATPTTCPLQYTDVPADSTFYSFIRCLACRGVISGYPCGGEGEPCDGENNPYFRPNVNVTRGQIAKIVSNSAGYDEDPNPQIYEDVDPSNTFYQWINRLSRRGHIGGYPCGTVPEEPCNPPDDRPYFRPFNNATRGQLAKIVSNAAGFADTPLEQIFADVPPENSFYLWIERLASRGIMGGYPCGGGGEPCDEQERPYFRPYNNVTRGQTSKIVAGAFFPNYQSPVKP